MGGTCRGRFAGSGTYAVTSFTRFSTYTAQNLAVNSVSRFYEDNVLYNKKRGVVTSLFVIKALRIQCYSPKHS